MSYTLVGGNFTRSYTSEALASYSVKLLASQQSQSKVDGVAFILLDPKGFLFVFQVDGIGSTPGRAILEGYNFGWNPALEHSTELTDKSGLSGTFTLSRALEAQGYTRVLNAGGPRTPELWAVYSAGKSPKLGAIGLKLFVAANLLALVGIGAAAHFKR